MTRIESVSLCLSIATHLLLFVSAHGSPPVPLPLSSAPAYVQIELSAGYDSPEVEPAPQPQPNRHEQDAVIEKAPSVQTPKPTPAAERKRQKAQHRKSDQPPQSAAEMPGSNSSTAVVQDPTGNLRVPTASSIEPARSDVFATFNPKPVYPASSRRLRHVGVVVLNVSVNSEGTVSGVKIHSSSGFPELDQSAVDAVLRWKFQPASLRGTPVESEVEVPIRFQLSEQN